MMAMTTKTGGRTSAYMRRDKNKEKIVMGGTNKDGGAMITVAAMGLTTETAIGGRMHKDLGRNKNRGHLTGRNNKEGRMLQAMATTMAPPLATAMIMIIIMATTIAGGIYKDMERNKTGGQHMWMDSKSGQIHLRAMGIIVAMQMGGDGS